MKMTTLEKVRRERGWSKSELGRRACIQSGLVAGLKTADSFHMPFSSNVWLML